MGGGTASTLSLLPPSLQLNHTHGVSRLQLPWASGPPEAVSGLLGKGTNLKRKRVPSPAYSFIFPKRPGFKGSALSGFVLLPLLLGPL